MLVRRIMNHVTGQNWTSIALELIVGFVGILAAFQVDRWYEERQLLSEEQAHLMALAADFNASRESLERALNLMRGAVDAALIILEHEPGGPTDMTSDDFYSLLRDVQYMSAFEPQRRAYDVLVASGDIRVLTDEQLKADMAEYFARAAQADDRRNEMIMQRVTSFEPYLNENLDHAALVLKVHPNVSETMTPSLPSDHFLTVLGKSDFEGMIVTKLHSSYDATSYLGRLLDLNVKIDDQLANNLERIK